jgi:hypothetical protein
MEHTRGISRNPLHGVKNGNFYAGFAAMGLGAAPFPSFEEYKAEKEKTLSYNFTHDPEVSRNPHLNTRVPQLIERIFDNPSPLWVATKRGNSDIVEKFRNPDFAPAALPQIDDHTLLFSIKQMILITAMHDLYNPLYRRENESVPRTMNVDELKAKIITMRQPFIDETERTYEAQMTYWEKGKTAWETTEDYRRQMEKWERDKTEWESTEDYMMQMAIAETSEPPGPPPQYEIPPPHYPIPPPQRSYKKNSFGTPLIKDYNAVLRIIDIRGPAIFNDEYLQYHTKIPDGAHIIFDFEAAVKRVFHHGVYIGNKTVVEILNYRDKARRLKTYQTLTHINEFLGRALGSGSPIIMRTYTNPFPADEIVKRAIWSLGEFPQYNLHAENCETAASWVCSNVYKAEHFCIGPATVFSHVHAARFNNNNADTGSPRPETTLANPAVNLIGVDGGFRKYSRRFSKKRKSTRRRKV